MTNGPHIPMQWLKPPKKPKEKSENINKISINDLRFNI